MLACLLAVAQFALLVVAGDSVRSTPGRPEELAARPGVLDCPMCANHHKTVHVRWDMHAPDHGISQRADARGYIGKGSNIFARAKGKGGPVDCLANPGGVGCAGPH